jgi:hypothetical protein
LGGSTTHPKEPGEGLKQKGNRDTMLVVVPSRWVKGRVSKKAEEDRDFLLVGIAARRRRRRTKQTK